MVSQASTLHHGHAQKYLHQDALNRVGNLDRRLLEPLFYSASIAHIRLDPSDSSISKLSPRYHVCEPLTLDVSP